MQRLTVMFTILAAAVALLAAGAAPAVAMPPSPQQAGEKELSVGVAVKAAKAGKDYIRSFFKKKSNKTEAGKAGKEASKRRFTRIAKLANRVGNGLNAYRLYRKYRKVRLVFIRSCIRASIAEGSFNSRSEIEVALKVQQYFESCIQNEISHRNRPT